MIRSSFIAVGLAIAASGARADLQADATVTGTPIGGGVYHYTISLHNTGTTTVGSLWFSWIPGENFMLAVPTNITGPAGWTPLIVGSLGPSSILWGANSPAARLAAGGTLATFAFDSTLTPAEMADFAITNPAHHVTTSFVYSGAAFSDAGYQFNASVVPAPAGAAVLLLGALGGAARRSRR